MAAARGVSAAERTAAQKRKRYLSVQYDRAFSRAVKAVAAAQGLSISDYLERLVVEANPDIEAIARKFERG